MRNDIHDRLVVQLELAAFRNGMPQRLLELFPFFRNLLDVGRIEIDRMKPGVFPAGVGQCCVSKKTRRILAVAPDKMATPPRMMTR